MVVMEDLHTSMDAKNLEVLLSEIRALRSDIKHDVLALRKEVDDLKSKIWKLESKIMVLSIILGMAGGGVAKYLPFLN